MAGPWTERYPCASTSPARARHFCNHVLRETLAGRPGAEAVVGDAEMVVSELVTNAVDAGGSYAELVVSVHQGIVRVEVGDDAAGVPRRSSPGVDATSGRGLMIVEALSDGWGILRDAGGKRVWAELSARHAAVR